MDPGQIQQVKMAHKATKNKKVKKFNVLNTGCSLWRAGGFSCSLKVVYKGLRTKIVGGLDPNSLNFDRRFFVFVNQTHFFCALWRIT